MSTFSVIKQHVRSNLNDEAVTFYSQEDIDESVKDGYDDVAFFTRNLIRKVTLDFQAGPYVNFVDLGVTDFMCVVAIFNNNTNRFLKDNLAIRHFDGLRSNWELWEGEAEFWAPLNFQLNAIVPFHSVPEGTFDLYYAATPPFILADTESPQIVTDYQDLLEDYSTGDLLEQAEEFTKAGDAFKRYFDALEEYKDLMQNVARRDLLLKI